MVKYTPPPEDLSGLNPIQRYMQKGSLDWADWARLIALVVAYWFLRPHLERLAKKWFGEAAREGEQETEAYRQRRAAAAVDANAIRSAKPTSDSKMLGQTPGNLETSTTSVSTNNQDVAEVKNRKKKSKGVSFAPEKSEIDKTLDWEDESEFDPRKGPVAVAADEVEAKGEIEQWLNKWS